MIPVQPAYQVLRRRSPGYFKATVTPERMRLDLRFVTSVENPNGIGYTERSWVVEDGVPGAGSGVGRRGRTGLSATLRLALRRCPLPTHAASRARRPESGSWRS